MTGKLTTDEIHAILNQVVTIVQMEVKAQREKDAAIVREAADTVRGFAAQAIAGHDYLRMLSDVATFRIETQPDETVAHVQQALRELTEARAKNN